MEESIIIFEPEFEFSLKKCGDVVPYGMTQEDRDKLNAAITKAEAKTYDEITSLIAWDRLLAGQMYVITDYQTVHTIPNTSDINTGVVEPLVVTAISTNKLAPEAYSLLYPQDIIYYDIENNQSMVDGCTKGYIYRRIDTKKNNDIGFDFRNVKFRRWQVSQPTWNSGEIYNRGSVVKHVSNNTLWMSIKDNNVNNATNDSDYWRQFEFDNLAYISPFGGSWDRSDEFTFVLNCTENYQDYKMWAEDSYYDTAYNNKLLQNKSSIIGNSNSVIFGSYFYYNSIGSSFNYNSIGSSFNYNSIGSGFNSNSIGSGFNSNSIGNDFNNNSIGNYFGNNSTGNNFSYNSIGNDSNYNSIGSSFNYNSIGSGFNSNSIGNDFNNNSISDNFQNVSGTASGITFTAEHGVYDGGEKELFKNSAGKQFVKFYDEYGVLTIISLD